MNIIIFTILIIVFIRHIFFWRVKDKLKYHNEKTVFHSHRGYKHLFPENSLEAIIEAEKHGFSWVEFDVVGTKDGQLVCSHNFDLERETNGRGDINTINSKNLKTIINGVYNNNINNVPLCFIEDIIDKTGDRLYYNIEIKAPNLFDLTTARALGKKVNKIPVNRVLVSSFNPLVLLYFKTFHKNIKTAFLYQNIEYLWIINLIHPSYIHPRADLIDDNLISYCKLKNIGINAWTVNNYQAIEWGREKQLDGVITDLGVFK